MSAGRSRRNAYQNSWVPPLSGSTEQVGFTASLFKPRDPAWLNVCVRRYIRRSEQGAVRAKTDQIQTFENRIIVKILVTGEERTVFPR